jgi:hypothetical protein
MPRANRHFVPGLVWHITHRCHNFKRRIVNGSKLDRAETSRDETIAGLSRSRSGSEGFVEQVKIELGLRAQLLQLPWRTVCILFENRCRLMATK